MLHFVLMTQTIVYEVLYGHGHCQVFLHSLPASCFFNIVIFGSSFQSLFPQVCSYQTFHHHHCQPIIVMFFIITTIATVIPIIIFIILNLVINILPFTEPSLHRQQLVWGQIRGRVNFCEPGRDRDLESTQVAINTLYQNQYQCQCQANPHHPASPTRSDTSSVRAHWWPSVQQQRLHIDGERLQPNHNTTTATTVTTRPQPQLNHNHNHTKTRTITKTKKSQPQSQSQLQVRAHNDNARVFSLGVGSAADRHLVKGLARAGQVTEWHFCC